MALDFARRTNGDADPANDTLVVVTADHESGGFGIIGVGNERYAPAAIGRSVRDYAATFRFQPAQTLNLVHQLHRRRQRLPRRSGSAAQAADRLRRRARPLRELAVEPAGAGGHGGRPADPRRRWPTRGATGRARTATTAPSTARAIPGFLVPGTIENGATGCPDPQGCPDDTRASPLAIAGHTASDVPLSAEGPGAWQFTGVYENTDVFLKLLRAAAGSYPRLRP